MRDIREILNELDEEHGLTNQQIMEIAGVKERDTVSAWWGGRKPSKKAHAKLELYLQSLAPVEQTCPYGIPTEQMFKHALELRLEGLYRAYPWLKEQKGHWRNNGRNKDIPDIDWNDGMRLPHHKERLLTKKHYYELGWTNSKKTFPTHYEISRDLKIRIVAEFHDDATIRTHFQSLLGL